MSTAQFRPRRPGRGDAPVMAVDFSEIQPMSATVQTESRLIATNRGYDIASTFFHSGGEVQGSILIVAAMGVAQRFYAPLAAWLASRGFLVATFDYFGIGLSRKSDPASIDISITDWARHDCEAMIDALARDSPGKPLYWIGHSLGGQIPGLVPNRERISKMITIACGSGYWLENPLSLRLTVWWLWYVAAPLSIRVFGYFPGKRLRKVGDLPRGVMQQWRRWCLDRDYAVGAEGPEVAAQYAAVRIPITSISFADDEFMSLKNTQPGVLPLRTDVGWRDAKCVCHGQSIQAPLYGFVKCTGRW